MEIAWHSLTLHEQIQKVKAEFSSIDFEVDIVAYKYPASEAMWLRGADYYKGLAGYVKLSGAQTALEIGTLFGGSAIALAKYATNVIAADIDLSRVDQGTLFCRNIAPYQCKSPDDCLSIPLDGIDIIFVDIDHSGRMETEIHGRLCREFRGTVFYDDIDLTPGMQKWWRDVQCEKVSTGWHQTGFGAIRYQ